MSKRLDHRVAPPCIKLCRVPPSPPPASNFPSTKETTAGESRRVDMQAIFCIHL